MKAQTKDSTSVSFKTFETLKIENPWLKTSNPAGLNYNKGPLPKELDLRYKLEDGDYKRVQQGDQINYYSFSTKSYLKIEDVNLFGSFSYDKSYERNLDYSNTNNPYRETPYDYIDTIGGDTYDREFFYLNGALSKPLGESTIFGLGVDFGVGVSVQGNDPRPENKVLDLLVTPGIIHSFSKVKFGLNFIYQYYNEEIEIDIIEENATATIFKMLGPAINYINIEGTSFNRLYKRNSYGGDLQLNYSLGNLNVLLSAKGIYFKETTEDGGKSDYKSWNYMRNYSRFEGMDWNFYTNIQLKKNLLIHNIDGNFRYLTTLGTEIIEDLDLVGDLDNEDWVYYADEPKYASRRIGAELEYDYIKMNNSVVQNYTIKLRAKYNLYEQEYHMPEQWENYENIVFGLAASKDFSFKKSLISLGVDFDYKMHITGKQRFEETNFIYDLITQPDFKFLTDNYYAPALNLLYEKPLTKIFDKIFIDTKSKLFIGENGQSRLVANFSLGVIF